MTLMAAFQLLLHRYAGQADVAVGTPMAGRVRSELEGLIGMFVNTLVIRSNVSGDLSFREFLSQVRDTSLEAQSHQDLPFERLVEELQPQRDLSRNPLFQVVFALQTIPEGPLPMPGLHTRSLPLSEEISKTDLFLSLWDADETGGIEGAWTYAKDLFDATTIQRMQEHFQFLLESIVADPDASVGDLALMGEEERRTLMDDWCKGPETELPDGLGLMVIVKSSNFDRNTASCDPSSVRYLNALPFCAPITM